MTRPPAFPPSGPRQRPLEVEAELRRYARRGASSSTAIVHQGEITDATEPASQPAGVIPAEESRVSLRLRERLAELRSAQRRARLRTLGIAGAIAALLAVGIWLVGFSPVFAFKMEELRVSGTSEYITGADVKAVMAPYAGTPLLRLDTQAIAAELQDNHAVKGVEFERSWPSGIKITLTPRVAVAATPADSGFIIIDGEGVELSRVAEPVDGLPVIELTRDDDGLAATIVAVLHVMDALPPQILEQVADVGARTANDVRFTLDSGAEVIWGSADDSDLKASVLEALLQAPARVYNVTTPMTPITS